MRKKFFGWYPKNEDEINELWKSAYFVPDNNVLLHFLRHTAAVRSQLTRLFKILDSSLWVPYQAALEFQRSKLHVEAACAGAYSLLKKHQKLVFQKFKQNLNDNKKHPILDIDQELKIIDDFEHDFYQRIDKANSDHAELSLSKIHSEIAFILENRVGENWSAKDESEAKKEFEDRKIRQIPPGYTDRSPGDYFIWKQMIVKAALDKRPIIFITDDGKEDWWWKLDGRTIGPRPELIQEFFEKTGQDLHIYNVSQFLRFAMIHYPEIDRVSAMEDAISDAENSVSFFLSDEQIAESYRNELENKRLRVLDVLNNNDGISPQHRNNLKLVLRNINRSLDELALSM